MDHAFTIRIATPDCRHQGVPSQQRVRAWMLASADKAARLQIDIDDRKCMPY
jgi:hypothetical protein